jgi:hypothetical protein
VVIKDHGKESQVKTHTMHFINRTGTGTRNGFIKDLAMIISVKEPKRILVEPEPLSNVVVASIQDVHMN